MQPLLDIGFQLIGRWELAETGLRLSLERWNDVSPALYAFVVSEDVVYVGKTTRALEARLYGYVRGNETQRTNARVRGDILEALRQGRKVQILGFRDQEPRKLGQFLINLPAALEDDIIRRLRPAWNGGRNEPVPGTETRTKAKAAERQPNSDGGADGTASARIRADILRPSFVVTIGKTYYRQGFFNVPVDYERYFAGDGASIQIDLRGRTRPVEGTVNRSVNANHTPRVMGRTAVRDWFHESIRVDQRVRVVVYGPRHIELTPA